MDSSTWVNTSLGLNLFPVDSHQDQPPLPTITKKVEEFEGEYAIFESNLGSPKQEASSGAGAGAGGFVSMAAEELKRITMENKKLAEMLTVLCENYKALETHVKELTITKQLRPSAENELMISPGNTSCCLPKKRKSPADDYCNNVNMIGFSANTVSTAETSSSEEESYKRPKEMSNINLKISRVYVRCDVSDSGLIVKDGFQWRKYGQKVTRDNPSPRAYYKCSFAPSCPVKKKVQKSAEDPCLMVATYEGEHNHIHPAGPQIITIDHQGGRSSNIFAPKISSSPSSSPTTASMSLSSSCVLDSSTEPAGSSFANQGSREALDDQYDDKATNFQQLLVQQMASSLTKNPNFTTALAAAISAGSRFNILDQQPHPPIPKW